LKLKIKELRNQKKLSIRQLSKKSEVAQGYLSQLENNKFNNPTLLVMLKICKILKCTLNDLVDLEEE